jgi:cytochrome c556
MKTFFLSALCVLCGKFGAKFTQPHYQGRLPSNANSKKMIIANAPQKGNVKRAETQVWVKLCEFALDPAYLKAKAKRLAYRFEQKQGTLQKNLQQLRDEQVLLTK